MQPHYFIYQSCIKHCILYFNRFIQPMYALTDSLTDYIWRSILCDHSSSIRFNCRTWLFIWWSLHTVWVAKWLKFSLYTVWVAKSLKFSLHTVWVAKWLKFSLHTVWVAKWLKFSLLFMFFHLVSIPFPPFYKYVSVFRTFFYLLPCHTSSHFIHLPLP